MSTVLSGHKTISEKTDFRRVGNWPDATKVKIRHFLTYQIDQKQKKVIFLDKNIKKYLFLNLFQYNKLCFYNLLASISTLGCKIHSHFNLRLTSLSVYIIPFDIKCFIYQGVFHDRQQNKIRTIYCFFYRRQRHSFSGMDVRHL